MIRALPPALCRVEMGLGGLGGRPLPAWLDWDRIEDNFVDPGEYAGRMLDTTTIRVSLQTHSAVSRLARQRHESIDQTVDRALRALRQVSMGRELDPELTDDERAWLDAELG